MENKFLDKPITIQINAAPCVNLCHHCLSSESPNKYKIIQITELELILEKIFSLTEYAGWNDKPFIFFRAELFVYPNFLEAVQILQQYGFGKWIINIPTNGNRISCMTNYKDVLLKLKKMGLKTLRFTLFGLEKTHDWFAGREGAFNDVITASIRASEAGINVKWIFFIHSQNAEELSTLDDLSREYVTDEYIPINIAAYFGRAISNEELRPTSKDLKVLPSELLDHVDPDIKTEQEWVTIALKGNFPDEPIKRILNSISIEKNGNIRDITVPYCGFGAPIIGNLYENNIKDIFNDYKSEGSKKVNMWLNVSNKILANKYGNKVNLCLYDATSIRLKWFRNFLKASTVA